MKKLSEVLHELAANPAANTEQKVTTAEKKSREKLEASIQRSRADAKARQEAFKAKVMELLPASFQIRGPAVIMAVDIATRQVRFRKRS